MPGAVVGDREHDLAVPPRELDLRRACRRARARSPSSSEKTSASAVARLPASEHRLELAPRPPCPAPTPCTSIARSRSSRSARSTSSSRRSVSTSCTAAIARIRLTESSSALRESICRRRARLQAQERRDGLQVVLDAVVDLLGEHAAHHGTPVLERDGRVLRDRREQLAVVLGERRRAVGDELADLPAAPAQRLADRVRVGPALGPGDRPSSSTSAAPVAAARPSSS